MSPRNGAQTVALGLRGVDPTSSRPVEDTPLSLQPNRFIQEAAADCSPAEQERRLCRRPTEMKDKTRIPTQADALTMHTDNGCLSRPPLRWGVGVAPGSEWSRRFAGSAPGTSWSARAVVRDERLVEAGRHAREGRCPARPTEAGMFTGVMDRKLLQMPWDGCGWNALFSRRPAPRCLVRHQSLISVRMVVLPMIEPSLGPSFGPAAGPNATCGNPDVNQTPEGILILAFCPNVFIGAWSAGRRLSGWQPGDSATNKVIQR